MRPLRRSGSGDGDLVPQRVLPGFTAYARGFHLDHVMVSLCANPWVLPLWNVESLPLMFPAEQTAPALSRLSLPTRNQLPFNPGRA